RPAARLVPFDTPRIGAPLQVTVDNLPADAAFLLLGFSNTSSAFGSLPLDLAAFGMPGCTLHTSVDDIALLLGSGGRAVHTIAIPDDPAFVGIHFYQQAVVIDPAAGNAFGA